MAVQTLSGPLPSRARSMPAFPAVILVILGNIALLGILAVAGVLVLLAGAVVFGPEIMRLL